MFHNKKLRVNLALLGLISIPLISALWMSQGRPKPYAGQDLSSLLVGYWDIPTTSDNEIWGSRFWADGRYEDIWAGAPYESGVEGVWQVVKGKWLVDEDKIIFYDGKLYHRSYYRGKFSEAPFIPCRRARDCMGEHEREDILKSKSVAKVLQVGSRPRIVVIEYMGRRNIWEKRKHSPEFPQLP